MSNFDYAGPLNEMLMAGNVATRLGRAIEFEPLATPRAFTVTSAFRLIPIRTGGEIVASVPGRRSGGYLTGRRGKVAAAGQRKPDPHGIP